VMALHRKDQSVTRFLACFKEACKPAFHICRAILESFFYAYSAIVDSFVMVSFFLRKITFRSIIVDRQIRFVLV